MAKQPTNPSISNLINLFNFMSKCIGFAVMNPNDSSLSKFFREIIFFSLLSFSALFTYQLETWIITVLKMKPSVRKIIIFAVTQIIVIAPFGCLVFFRLCDFTIRKIILKVENLEDNLLFCNTHLDIVRIGLIGVFFWIFQIFVVMSMVYCSLWSLLTELLFDFFRLLYFEAWTMIPYLQFVVWISFLTYVLRRVQFEIIEINQLAYLTEMNFCVVKERVSRMTWKGYEFDRVVHVKKFIGIMKQVLNISKELSAAYGPAVSICVVQYISRIILQFYDLIDRDAQMAPVWTAVWSILVRLFVLLPVFVCCEQFSYNVNKTVELIQEIVMLYQPSCLDRIFESLTLRLQHQSATIQICGFLNITYRNFLTIMTTAIAFLVFQLQF